MSKLNNSLSLKIWNEWQVNNFDDNLFAFKVTGRASVISQKLDGHNVNLEFYLHSGYKNKEHIYIIQDLLNFAMACSFLLAQARVGHGALTERGLHAWRQMNRVQNSRER